MPNLNFTEALSNLRRQRAATTGRQPSRNEVSGVIEAQANTAQERLQRSQQLKLAEEELAQRKFETEQQIRLAEEANAHEDRLAKKQQKSETGALLGYAGGVGLTAASNAGLALVPFATNPLTAPFAIGAAVLGFLSGGSHLCTASDKVKPQLHGEKFTLLRFRQWCNAMHPLSLQYYFDNGPRLVKAMDDSEVGLLYEELIEPVINFVRRKQYNAAYDHYRKYVLSLVDRYLPNEYQDWLTITG